MSTRPHDRVHSFGLPDGTQPLVQTGLRNIFAGGVSILRERVQLELYVEAVSSTGNLINFAAMTTTRAAMGIISYDTPTLQTVSASPLTTAANPMGSQGWLCWEPMHPRIDYFKESDVETAVWTYRTEPIMVDVQGRRRTTVGNNPSWWLAWEIVEDSGTAFINQTVSGTTYALGYRYYADVLLEQF